MARSFFLSRDSLHDLQEAWCIAGVIRVSQGEVEGSPPAFALTLGRAAGAGVKPPPLFTGKLSPTCQKGVNVGAFAIFHQGPEQDRKLTHHERAESILACAQRRRMRPHFLLIHATQKLALDYGGDLTPGGRGNHRKLPPRIPTLRARQQRETAHGTCARLNGKQPVLPVKIHHSKGGRHGWLAGVH